MAKPRNRNKSDEKATMPGFIKSLTDRLDRLELLYYRAAVPDLFEDQGQNMDINNISFNDIFCGGFSSPVVDIKALQGIERCIELRMKLFGIDGKKPLCEPEFVDKQVSIELDKLTDSTLKELLNLIDAETYNKL